MTKETKTEGGLMRRIMLKVTESPAVRVFRNNVGVAIQGKIITENNGSVVMENARRVRFGLCEGSSDLIGWTSLEITPAMVGRRVAVFTALEVKKPRKTPTTGQQNFLAEVRKAGGFAEVVTDPEDAQHELSLGAWLGR